MQQQQGDVEVLGTAISRAQEAVRETLQGLSAASPSTSAALNKQIQSELSTYRRLLRDFELLVEEEDR